MRETNLADWRRQNSRATDVKIVTQDSTGQKGSILVPNDGSLHSVLEDSSKFLELKMLLGETRYICKAAILSIEALEMIKTDQLENSMKKMHRKDAHSVLKIPLNSDRKMVKEAYRRLAVEYHPDRYIAHNAPKEIVEYVTNVSKFINRSYMELKERTGEADQLRAKPSAATRYKSARV